MSIPESQLDTWSNQGAVTSAKSTHESIRNALKSYDKWPDDLKYEVYLQGSYKNSTNIYSNSDVDVVARMTSSFYSNLTSEQKKYLEITTGSHNFSEFKAYVLEALQDYYGSSMVAVGNKSIKLDGETSRLNADIVPCVLYKKYKNTTLVAKGMTFWTLSDLRIINFPKLHYKNGSTKNSNTSNWYKPSVRMFKNVRECLVRKGLLSKSVAPSYFIECLLYNVLSSKYGSTYQNTYENVLEWLENKDDMSSFVCQNGQDYLFGSSSIQWSTLNARTFIAQLRYLWDNWYDL